MTRPSRAARLYRWLLRLLPGDFRGDFGDSMARDFADADAGLTGAARRRFHGREWPGLARTAVTQWVAAAWRDAGFTLRMLARSPGFALAAVLMLAIGTGANAAIFSVIDAVLLRPSAVDPARIATINEGTPGHPAAGVVPVDHLQAYAAAPEFEAVAAMGGGLPILTGVGAPHRLWIDCVSASMFRLMSATPAYGRVFTEAEDRPGAAPVVVLSDLAWQRDFGGDTAVVGRSITLSGVANTVIGVMPAGFLGPQVRNKIDAWAPFGASVGQPSPAGCGENYRSVDMFARVRAPLTLEAAAASINASGRLAGLRTRAGILHPTLVLTRADENSVGAMRTPLAVLLGAVGCVLLIACANVANLQLERLVGRRRELAMRLALGATRNRLVRQTLVENLIVSGAGAVAGLLVARLTLGAIVALMPVSMPHVADIVVNTRTLVVTVLAALITGLAIGLLPALQATSVGLTAALAENSRAVAGGARWVRQSLVVLEVALSLVLLVSAGLLIQTFLILRPINPGFASDNRTVAEMLFRGDWQPDPAREQAVTAISERLAQVPGVAAVSMSSYLPLSGVTDLTHVTIGDTSADVWSSWSSPNYATDIGMSLMRGRLFTDADTASAPPVALVNQAMADRFWPSGNPIGQIIGVKAPNGALSRPVIVGILATARSWGTDMERRSELFMPYRQNPGSTLIYFVIRTHGPAPATLPNAIRATVAAVRPDQIVDRIETMSTKLDRSVAAPRFAMWLFGLFAAAGAALSVLGLAAVVAWWVAERRREIGVRMALGASASGVARAILAEGLRLVGAGLVMGLGLALLTTRLLKNWLYGVAAPADPTIFSACVVGMLAVTALATYIPARRVADIDPSVTLRAD